MLTREYRNLLLSRLSSYGAFSLHLLVCLVLVQAIVGLLTRVCPDLFASLLSVRGHVHSWMVASSARDILAALMVIGAIAGPVAILGWLYQVFLSAPTLGIGTISMPNRWHSPPRADPRELSRLSDEKRDLQMRHDALEQHIRELEERLSQLVKASELGEQANAQHERLIGEISMLVGHVQELSEERDRAAIERQLGFVLSECAAAATRVLRDTVPDKSAALFLLKRGADVLVIGGCSGISPVARRRAFREGEGFVGSVWETRQPQVCNNIAIDRRFMGPGLEPQSGYQSAIGVPIMDSRQGFCGVICVHSRKTSSFDITHDGQVLGLLASMVSICLYVSEE